MRRIWTAGAAVLIGLLCGGTVAGAAMTPLDFNISVNSGAEAGQGGKGGVVHIPLWQTTSKMTAVKYGTPGFPSKAVARASKGEVNLFYCGKDTAGSEARQRVRISGRNVLVDAGALSLELTVRIGSNTDDGDAGRMIIRYLDGAGHVIGELGTTTVGATGGALPRVKASGPVPVGTRALQVVLQGTGTAGTSCDIFFDNVSVKLARVA